MNESYEPTIIVGSGVKVWTDSNGELYFSINKQMAREDSNGNYCAAVTKAQADAFFVELEHLKRVLYKNRVET